MIFWISLKSTINIVSILFLFLKCRFFLLFSSYFGAVLLFDSVLHLIPFTYLIKQNQLPKFWLKILFFFLQKCVSIQNFWRKKNKINVTKRFAFRMKFDRNNNFGLKIKYLQNRQKKKLMQQQKKKNCSKYVMCNKCNLIFTNKSLKWRKKNITFITINAII